MIKFWDKLSEGLAEKWTSRLLLHAAAFLSIGLLAWLWREGIDSLRTFLETTDAIKGTLIAIAGLMLLSILEWTMQQITLPLLRLLEGYWPKSFSNLAYRKAIKRYNQLAPKHHRLQHLAERYKTLDIKEKTEYNHLDDELMTYPLNAAHFMPTRLGNLLRAAEEYPYVRYGLEMKTTFPRLWLLLPQFTRDEISAARQEIDENVRLIIWGILTLLWTIWAWWAILAGGIVILAGIFSLYQCAGVYGELLRAAYDIHRFDLYQALHLDLPNAPEGEEIYGERLTLFLHRGECEDIDIFSPITPI